MRRLEQALGVEQLGLERRNDRLVRVERALEIGIERGELDRVNVALGLLGVREHQVQVLILILHARERVAEAEAGVGRDLRLGPEHATYELVDAHARDRAAVPEVLARRHRALDLRERCVRVVQRRLDRLPGQLGNAHVVAAGCGPRLTQTNDPSVGPAGHGRDSTK